MNARMTSFVAPVKEAVPTMKGINWPVSWDAIDAMYVVEADCQFNEYYKEDHCSDGDNMQYNPHGEEARPFSVNISRLAFA